MYLLTVVIILLVYIMFKWFIPGIQSRHDGDLNNSNNEEKQEAHITSDQDDREERENIKRPDRVLRLPDGENHEEPTKSNQHERKEEDHVTSETKTDSYMSKKDIDSASEECRNEENKTDDLDREIPIFEKKLDILENDEINMFRSCVDEKVLVREMKEHRTMHGVFKYINDNIERWREQKITIGVTGLSGAGKSSLINALRGMKPTDVGAAKVGIVETSFEPTDYTYPNNKNVTLTDLPGMGTLKFKRDQYLTKINFERFDILIIVFAGRVSQDDIELARTAIENKKHVLFVRTRIDEALTNEFRDIGEDIINVKPEVRQKKELFQLKKMRDNIDENLKEGKLDLKDAIYLVSSPYQNKYDFQKMDTQLRGFMNKKGQAVSKLIFQIVKEAIDQKRVKNKDDFYWRKFVCTFISFIMLSYSQSMIKQIEEICLERFCLDKASQTKMDGEMKKLVSEWRITGKFQNDWNGSKLEPTLNIFRILAFRYRSGIPDSKQIVKVTDMMSDAMASVEKKNCIIKTESIARIFTSIELTKNIS